MLPILSLTAQDAWEPVLGGTNQQALTDAPTFVAAFPSNLTVHLAPENLAWTHVDRVKVDIFWPPRAPAEAQVLIHLMDWDYLWYQKLLPGTLTPGTTNELFFDLYPSALPWETIGHHSAWHFRSLAAPREFALRIFSSSSATVTGRITRARARPRVDTAPPEIRHVRFSREPVPCFNRFEITYRIPDRYVNPFDPDTVHTYAEIIRPDGTQEFIDGFYFREAFRKTTTTGETIHLQHGPEWKLRYAPRIPGTHRFRLHVRDRHGHGVWGPGSFEAVTSRCPGFVRVSATDPRFLEFDDGSPFFPIGHNIRSPFDERHDRRFPWMQRWPTGPSIYEHYFKLMAEHGQNVCEIWRAAWSLGLEWNSEWPGYHGIGQYNMYNARAMDWILDAAQQHGIYINYVVHNHGKFGTLNDREWELNPFNLLHGGYLESPKEYFYDPRALRAFEHLMRYTIARWGYSPHIFSWEFWSELNLAGASRQDYRSREVVDWHRMMARQVKNMDPYRRPVSTHFSGDYEVQNPEIIALPALDLCPMDAYHGSSDPLHIVTLMRESAAFNVPFGKPFLITEFGGSSQAQDKDHLVDTLHAALWSSPAIPIAGTPMLWWWGLIDEEYLYPMFAALERFMRNEDRRDPRSRSVYAHVTAPDQKAALALYTGSNDVRQVAAIALMKPDRALGWVYRDHAFSRINPNGPATVTNLTLHATLAPDTAFVIEYWDTAEGTPVHRAAFPTDNHGTGTHRLPAFARDIAFKIYPDPRSAH